MVEQVPDREPRVWVDPNLYIERPPVRIALGMVPPPTCVGAHCELEYEVPELEGLPFILDED